jgi:hypothetical protein
VNWDTFGTFVGLVFLVLFVIGGVRYHRDELRRENEERYGSTEREP